MRKLMKIGILILCFQEMYAQDLENIAKQKPFAITGSLDIRGIGYSASGIAARRSPFMYIISGSPTVSLYGIAIPLSFTYSEQDRSFRQPFNQFGMSPTYKWATAHVGFRNVSFLPYTLAGYTMLGAGVELNPKKFRFGFMAGRLNRATTVDTTTGAVQPYSFSRFGYAAKIGYGTEENHFDLSFLSAKDREKDFKGDLATSQVRPAANVVVGGDLKLMIVKKIFVFADVGISVYTRDFNSSMAISTDSLKVLNTLNKLIKLNGTSEYYVAYSGGVGYKEKNFGLKLAYKYVDPDFQSMGAYFFQNDIKNFTISPTFNALKGKLRLMGSLGLQQDNTKQQKQATTKRVIGLLNLSYDVNEKFGVDANYTNFSSNSEPTVALVQNKYLLTQTTSNISVNPRLVLANVNTTNVFLLSYNVSNLVDVNDETKITNNINSSVALLNHNITLNKIALTIMSGVNYTTNKLADQTIDNMGFTLGASKGFLKNKLQVSSSNSYIISKLPQGNNTIINLGGNVAYQPFPKHRFSLRVNSLSNKPDEEVSGGAGRFSEFTGEFGYTLSF
ncbi:hypothetical protein GVN16_18740 [Emticicia sp. CRIBPO]|uniref:hypothetical protein n=1 Tax=Emticicia sp. CRIBPO TaxID=2683258 RepID=UPI0014130AB6|nr:hypothetical protein [Emticicia sp. CRIBPO]NBA87814.1 hypothetical protein [Emticicia sp. CRIBPO]